MITGKAKLAGVIGWPIQHSRSPLLHNFWINRYQLDAAYIPLAVRPEDFKSVIKSLVIAGFKGLNVTIPHKEIAFHCCDYLDDAAKKMGSVNTLIFDDHQKIIGTSTDGFGYVSYLESKQIELKNKKILILGAGGAARSLLYALHQKGAKISIANRTQKRANDITNQMGIGMVIDWNKWDQLLSEFDILINTTSIGMDENNLEYKFNLNNARSDLVVSDIVYVPLETPLLRKAKQLNLKTIDGLGMLLHQAKFGFSQWFGIEPIVDHEIFDYIAASLNN